VEVWRCGGVEVWRCEDDLEICPGEPGLEMEEFLKSNFWLKCMINKMLYQTWRFRIFCSRELAKFRNDALGVETGRRKASYRKKIAAKQDFYPLSPCQHVKFTTRCRMDFKHVLK
jgi:hypothetical protein